LQELHGRQKHKVLADEKQGIVVVRKGGLWTDLGLLGGQLEIRVLDCGLGIRLHASMISPSCGGNADMKMDGHRPTVACAMSLLAIAITATVPAASQRAPSLPDLARSVSPAVVVIVTSDKNGNPLAEGSGFVVDANGLIATNLHVIRGAYSASVTLANGDTYDSVLVADADSRKDLALLQIKAVDLKPVRFGDSDSVQVGQHVVAVGNPRGLANSVSDGIVSAVRQVEGMRLLQTTAPISHGSSGGPLLNDNAEVIGVTRGTYPDGENLNFAIPANYLKPMLRFLNRSTMRPLPEFNAGSLETAEADEKTVGAKGEQVKADVTLDGAWFATIADAKGSATVQFNLIESSDGDVAGTYTTSLGGGGQIRGSLKDSQFTFELKQSLQNCSGIFKGTAKVNAGNAVGTYTGTDCLGDHGKGSLTMTKSGGLAESAKTQPTAPGVEITDGQLGELRGLRYIAVLAASNLPARNEITQILRQNGLQVVDAQHADLGLMLTIKYSSQGEMIVADVQGQAVRPTGPSTVHRVWTYSDRVIKKSIKEQDLAKAFVKEFLSVYRRENR
jgi:S1-C subfamily serine protease